MSGFLTAEEIAHVVDYFLRSHPWVEERIANAPDDGTAARIAQSELRNGGFWAGEWAADGLTAPSRGVTVTRTPRLSGGIEAVIRWSEVAKVVRHGKPHEQLALFG